MYYTFSSISTFYAVASTRHCRLLLTRSVSKYQNHNQSTFTINLIHYNNKSCSLLKRNFSSTSSCFCAIYNRNRRSLSNCNFISSSSFGFDCQKRYFSKSTFSSNKMTSSITIVERGNHNTGDYRIFYRNESGPISPFHDIPLLANSDEKNKIFNMVVEIPRWTNAKMEIATKEPSNPIKQDVKKGQIRYVANCFPHHGYIWNYGALPQTWENPGSIDSSTGCKGDNDPIDVCEIGGKVHKRGAIVQVKVLGCFALIDEGETDWKILAIDVTDPIAEKLNGIEDVEKLMPGYLRATVEWFRIYKIPDGKPENQFAFNGEPKNAEFALKVIEETNKFWIGLSNKNISNEPGIALERTIDTSSPFAVTVEAAEAIINAVPEPTDTAGAVDPYVNKWHFVTVNPN